MIPVRRFLSAYTWYSSPIAHLPYEINLEALCFSVSLFLFSGLKTKNISKQITQVSNLYISNYNTEYLYRLV